MLCFLQRRIKSLLPSAAVNALWHFPDRHSSCRIADFARTLIQTPCRDIVCNRAMVVNHRNQRIPEQIECTEFNSWAQLAADCAELQGAGMEGSLTSERANKQGLKERGKERKEGSRCCFRTEFHHASMVWSINSSHGKWPTASSSCFPWHFIF